MPASTVSTLVRLKYGLTRVNFQDENCAKVQVYTTPLKTLTYDERHTRLYKQHLHFNNAFVQPLQAKWKFQ